MRSGTVLDPKTTNSGASASPPSKAEAGVVDDAQRRALLWLRASGGRVFGERCRPSDLETLRSLRGRGLIVFTKLKQVPESAIVSTHLTLLGRRLADALAADATADSAPHHGQATERRPPERERKRPRRDYVVLASLVLVAAVAAFAMRDTDKPEPEMAAITGVGVVEVREVEMNRLVLVDDQWIALARKRQEAMIRSWLDATLPHGLRQLMVLEFASQRPLAQASAQRIVFFDGASVTKKRAPAYEGGRVQWLEERKAERPPTLDPTVAHPECYEE